MDSTTAMLVLRKWCDREKKERPKYIVSSQADLDEENKVTEHETITTRSRTNNAEGLCSASGAETVASLMISKKSAEKKA